ncbi:MAG: tetratricopeptide repeat protein [Planctomycetota bacterium]
MSRSIRHSLVFAALLAGMSLALAGCGTSRGPYQPMREGARNTVLAEQLTRRAADLIDTKPDRAEELLRQALAADLYHGPAHNNLGVVFLNRGLLYEAASEFQWARRLMPGNPDPRMNLGLALEQAGMIDDALDSYRTALEVYPEHLPTIQALARAQLRHDRADDRTPALLEKIAQRSASSEWREWARLRLATQQ